MFNAVCLRWVIDQRKETKSWEVCRDRVNMHTDNKKLVDSVIFHNYYKQLLDGLPVFKIWLRFHDMKLDWSLNKPSDKEAGL